MGALVAVDSACRHSSFTEAAEELSLTPAAIAHQVRLFEAWFGRPLFERRPNGVTLTQAGREMGQRVRNLLDEAQTMGPEVRRQREVSQIVIRCQLSLAAKWLAPRVAQYAKLQPDCEFVVRVEPGMGDPLSGQADMAIYYARADTADTGDPLLAGRYVVVAAPSLLRQMGVKALDAHQIEAAPLIGFSPKNRGWPEPTWANWCASAGHHGKVPRPSLTTSMMQVAIEFSLSGAGFALVHEPFVTAELADGRLVLASDVSLRAPHVYTLTVRPSSATRQDVRLFQSWLLSQAVL